MLEASSPSTTVLYENHAVKSALDSENWARKNCKKDTETRPIVLLGKASQINA